MRVSKEYAVKKLEELRDKRLSDVEKRYKSSKQYDLNSCEAELKRNVASAAILKKRIAVLKKEIKANKPHPHLPIDQQRIKETFNLQIDLLKNIEDENIEIKEGRNSLLSQAIGFFN